MYNINSALMLTVSLPAYFAAGAADMTEDNWIFRVVLYLLAVSSGCFLFTLVKTSSWVTSGITFIADDLDALAFTSRFYPAGIGAGYVIGVWILGITMIFFVCDVLAHTDVADRWAIGAILGVIMFFAFMNQTYEWAYVFKKTILPPTVFWDATDSSKFKAKTGVEHSGNIPKKERMLSDASDDATTYTKKWNNQTASWVPVDTSDIRGKDFITVTGKTQLFANFNPTISLQDESGFTTNIRDKLESMRVYYDVPTEEVEPDPVVRQTPFSFPWLVSKIMTNGSGVIDNPEYIQWMFTWQLKPAWKRRLMYHLPADTIQLHVKPGAKEINIAEQNKDTVVARDWQTILEASELGAAWSGLQTQLSGIGPEQLENLSFANKLVAFETLGVEPAAMRIKLANAL